MTSRKLLENFLHDYISSVRKIMSASLKSFISQHVSLSLWMSLLCLFIINLIFYKPFFFLFWKYKNLKMRQWFWSRKIKKWQNDILPFFFSLFLFLCVSETFFFSSSFCYIYVITFTFIFFIFILHIFKWSVH